ncbi:transposase [Streptomyces mirabilis]|uniref:transposase n=1 Tax=Streptomyces mirabilis TaxID=68239 RepID=UPI0033F9B5D0
MTSPTLARHLAALRPQRLEAPEDAVGHALRTLAKRWQYLDAEAKELTQTIAELVKRAIPQLLEPFGIGVDTAAEILIVVGDNPERIKSEAALAKLAGIAPVPTGSGMTSGRHRINHSGHRQLNAAIYCTVIVRMRFHQPTIDYVTRRTIEGKSKREIIRCLIGCLCVCQAGWGGGVGSGLAAPGSDLSEELAVGVGPAALDAVVAPGCPPGPVAPARRRSSPIIVRQT